MRDKQAIKADIQTIKQEIRYAHAEGETKHGMEQLYTDLENLENELHKTALESEN